MLTRGFDVLRRNTKIILYPMIKDLLYLFYGLLFFNFIGHSTMTLKISISPGLPSIFNLLEDKNKFGFQIINLDNISSSSIFIVFLLLSIFIGSFIEAGYIGLLVDSTKKRNTNFSTFINYGKKFWPRFIGVAIITILLSFITIVFAFLFQIVGIFLALILYFILRIIFIFWEYTIVLDDLPTIDALTKSREYFIHRTPDTASIILTIFFINALFAFFLNLIPNEFIYLVGIIFYSYVASGFLLTLMLNLFDIKERMNPYNDNRDIRHIE